MATFIAHTIVHQGFKSVSFAPGDEVPEWAFPLIGTHVFEGDSPEPKDAGDLALGSDPDSSVEPQTVPEPKDAGALDFSSGAKPAEKVPVKSAAKPPRKK